jgi:hypothetical protein
MGNVLALLTPVEIRVLPVDQEFIGKKWLSWLQFLRVHYVVRMKKKYFDWKRFGKPSVRLREVEKASGAVE